MALQTPPPPHRTSTTLSTSLNPITPPTSTSTSTRSSISSKSPGSSPRSPLLLSATEPSTLTLSDDPTLDLDFELLFLHDDAPPSKRVKATRAKTTPPSTEHWNPTSTAPRPHPRPPASHLPPNKDPTTPGRRDWSTFHFSHYTDTGCGGAAGLRGKGRVAEMYTRNKAETAATNARIRGEGDGAENSRRDA